MHVYICVCSLLHMYVQEYVRKIDDKEDFASKYDQFLMSI